jgi:acyl carrier protein
MKEKILSIINEQFGIDNATEATRFDDLRCDSLDAIELLMAIEDEMEISISDEEFEREADRGKTVGDLIAAVQRLAQDTKEA